MIKFILIVAGVVIAIRVVGGLMEPPSAEPPRRRQIYRGDPKSGSRRRL